MKVNKNAAAKKATAAKKVTTDVAEPQIEHVATPIEEQDGAPEPTLAELEALRAEEAARVKQATGPVLVDEKPQVLKPLKGKGAKKARFMAAGHTEQEYLAHSRSVCEKRHFNQQVDRLMDSLGFSRFGFLNKFIEDVPLEMEAADEAETVAWFTNDCSCPVSLVRFMAQYATSDQEQHQVWFAQLGNTFRLLAGFKPTPGFVLRLAKALAAEHQPEPAPSMAVAA